MMIYKGLGTPCNAYEGVFQYMLTGLFYGCCTRLGHNESWQIH